MFGTVNPVPSRPAMDPVSIVVFLALVLVALLLPWRYVFGAVILTFGLGLGSVCLYVLWHVIVEG